MINLAEIEEEIARLEAGNTTYGNCERLSVLYAVRREFGGEPQPRTDSGYSFADRSEFVEAAMAAPKDVVLGILDEHMDAIKLLYPKEYDKILRQINAAI